MKDTTTICHIISEMVRPQTSDAHKNSLRLLSGFGVASIGLGNQACDEGAK